MEGITETSDSAMNTEMISGKNNPAYEDESKKRRLSIDNNPPLDSPNKELSQRLNTGNFTIDTAMGEMEQMISHFFKKKESFGQSFTIHSAYELLRKTSLEIIKISSKVINQDERNAALLDKAIQQEEKISSLMQQIINMQLGSTPDNNTKTYLKAAQENLSYGGVISAGKTLPLPQLPKEIQHAPAENIIIIKAEEKGETATVEMQETFRRTLKEIIGPQLGTEISAIRPSRQGGYTIILRGTIARDSVVKRLKETDVIHESRIIAPVKKYAKMVCRNFPKNVTTEEILKEFYGKHNMHLMMVPMNQRNAKVSITKLGWIFELTSPEAAAIDAQNGKVRFGFGQELKLEEFIPLQQCYRCSRFGHNAAECNSKDDICRLCANKGHSGRDCQYKNDKTQWKCFNCISANQERGCNLDTSHAAAQLHKCNVAGHERSVKRSQLAAAGVYITKASSGNMQIKNLQDEKFNMQHSKPEKARKNSSKNIQRRGSTSSNLNTSTNMQLRSATSSSASSSSSIRDRRQRPVLPPTGLTLRNSSSPSSSTSSSLKASERNYVNPASSAKSTSFSSSSSSANVLFPSRKLHTASDLSPTASSSSSSSINATSPINIFSCLYSDISNTPREENLEISKSEGKNLNEKENTDCTDTEGKIESTRNEKDVSKMNDKNENNDNKSENDKHMSVMATRMRGRGRGKGRGGNINYSNVGRGSGSDEVYQVDTDGMSGRTRSTSQLENVDMDM